MQRSSGPERFVLCTDRVELRCRCGGGLLLLGREEDWYSEGRTAFGCAECGRTLTLADRLDEEEVPPLIGGPDEADASARDLIRGLRAAGGP
ncbi:MAG: hypothetical protein M3N18_13010 [Actinomycetota bacterium]|nr:hypothetical protein [Actinomycetota bacterium]